VEEDRLHPGELTMATRRAPSWIAFFAVAAAMVVLVGRTGCASRTAHRGVNVILVSIDTLRPDRMGVYGHRPMGIGTTPFLEEMAASGAVFTGATSTSSWTLPGHYSLLTGLPDELHDMVDDRVPPPDDVDMLAEILAKEGYKTGGFYSGPYMHPFFGFGRGFDVYESCMGFSTVYDIPMARLAEMQPQKIARATARTEADSHEAVTSEAVTAAGLRFVKGCGENPFFLFLHYFDVHNDYTPPPPFDSRFCPPYAGWVTGRGVMTDPRIGPDMAAADLAHLKGLYDGEVAWVDENLRRLFRGLAPELLENTLVIITSDHGEEFFEHGEIGHRRTLYEESIRIPLIMRLPGEIPAGSTVSSPARIYDIAPTIVDLLDIPGAPDFFGRSLRGAMKGAGDAKEPSLHELTRIPGGDADRYWKHTALRAGGFKLVTVQEREWSRENPVNFAGPLISERHELYDLNADPGEERDLSDSNEELLEDLLERRDELWERLRDMYLLKRHGAAGAARTVPEDLARKIRAVGYGGPGKPDAEKR
jgi:arylsulfatase A-like enzyme